MRFAILGSGSEGNALVVQAGRTTLLLDCGFSLSEMQSRLARLSLQPEQLAGILVTHEHGDHISGVARLARKYSLPVWATHGTLRTQGDAFAGIDTCEISPHRAFAVADIEVQPFPVPHDAAEPVQFAFDGGGGKLGVLTDTGSATPHIEATLNGCHALVLECNHDAEMLRTGEYHYQLKQRVGGRYGHLNNVEAAALLGRLDNSQLQHIVTAHLSSKNNRPELAVAAISQVLGWPPGRIEVARQIEGLDWREIR